MPTRGRPASRADNRRERSTGMPWGVMVTGDNQGAWERLLREDYTRPPTVSNAANMDDPLFFGGEKIPVYCCAPDVNVLGMWGVDGSPHHPPSSACCKAAW